MFVHAKRHVCGGVWKGQAPIKTFLPTIVHFIFVTYRTSYMASSFPVGLVYTSAMCGVLEQETIYLHRQNLLFRRFCLASSLTLEQDMAMEHTTILPQTCV